MLFFFAVLVLCYLSMHIYTMMIVRIYFRIWLEVGQNGWYQYFRVEGAIGWKSCGVNYYLNSEQWFCGV